MTELTTLRHTPLVDPALHVWSWQIPVYLFLGGLVAGLMVIHAWFLLRNGDRARGSVAFLAPGLGLALLSAGMFALFLDLEHKAFVWRLYATFRPTSPMSWGAWILIAVYPALGAALLVCLPPVLRGRIATVDSWARRLQGNASSVRLIATANLTLGGLLGIYTGILLSTLGARPLWNSALLGPLFLTSGLSSAAALAHLLTRDREESAWLARADVRLLAIELVVLTLYLVGLVTSTQAHLDAARLFLGGGFTAVFWVGVVGLGLLLPLSLQVLAAGRRLRHTVVAPLLVLAGGLLLRVVFVHAGQVSHWGRS